MVARYTVLYSNSLYTEALYILYRNTGKWELSWGYPVGINVVSGTGQETECERLGRRNPRIVGSLGTEYL
jgi:hypothetical protein